MTHTHTEQTLTLSNLTVSYDRHPAVHHVSATFPKGSLTAITGPNGAGKSTLLKAIAGLLPIHSGKIEKPCQFCTDIGYLPQQIEIDHSFPVTALEFVKLGDWGRTGAFKAYGASVDQRAKAALEQVGLAAYAKRGLSQLSVGQFQRLLFARLMLQDARVLLLDEPFANVDTRTVRDLLPILQRWQAEGRTILAALHDLDLVRSFCPRTLLLARELIACGPTNEALTPDHLNRAKLKVESWEDDTAACAIDETHQHRAEDKHDHKHDHCGHDHGHGGHRHG